MVALLHLPNEILEMVVRPLIRTNDASSTSASSSLKMTGEVLSLRLIHSRFQKLADPLIFETFTCTISNKRSPATAGKAVSLLLGSQSAVGKHIKDLRLTCMHGGSARQSPYLQEGLQKALSQCHERVEQLSLDSGDENRSEIPLYASLTDVTFPNLRVLHLSDVAFVFGLLQIIEGAPLIDTVSLYGGRALPGKAPQKMDVKGISGPAARGGAQNPLDCLIIVDGDYPWIYTFLGKLALHARKLSLETRIVEVLETRHHVATADECFSGIKHMADSPFFKEVSIQDFHYRRLALGIRLFVIRILHTQQINKYLEEVEPQRARLISLLKAAWEGKEVALRRQKFIQDWRVTIESPDTKFGHLLEWTKDVC